MRPTGNHARSAILRSVMAIAGDCASDRKKPIVVVEDACSTDWASATFVGATHDFALRIEGEALAVTAAVGRIVAQLPEYEIALSGHIVAEIVVLPGKLRITNDHIVSKSLTVNALMIRD